MITARNAFKLLRTSFDDWNEDDGPRLGAALAFYTILSISPIVILAVAMVSLVFDRSQAQTHLLDQVQSLIGPEGRNAVQTLLASGQKKASGIVATLAGFVILVFGASGVFGELRSALNTIWEAKPQVGSGISGMLRISLLVSTALAALTTFLNGLLPLPSILSNTLNFIISFLGVAVLFGFILKSFLKQRSGGRMFE
jgi:membrane protein